MPTIRWSRKLSVRIPEIDLQHRQLVDVAADLEMGLALGVDKEIMNRVMRDLNAYAREHFATEERLMRRHGFPGLDEHVTQHQSFIEKLLHFELDYLDGRAELSKELFEYLIRWLEEHVASYDQLYAQHLREKGVA